MQSTIRDEAAHTTENQISAINDILAKKVGAQKYRIWFKNSTNLTLSEGYLKVGVPNLFVARWLENHFLNEINEAASTVIGTKLNITFIIDPELSGRQRTNQLDSQASEAAKEQNVPGQTGKKNQRYSKIY